MSPARRHTILLALLVVACSRQAPRVQPAPSGSVEWLRSRPDHDSLLGALRLQTLDRMTMREGDGEIRAWDGGGIALESDFIRLVRHGQKVTGEIVRFWRYRGLYQTGPEDTLWSQGDLLAWKTTLKCSAFVHAHGIDACTLRLMHPPDWQRLWDSVVALDPWTLVRPPDPPRAPGETVLVPCNDCSSANLEFRLGSRFRRATFGFREKDPRVVAMVSTLFGALSWDNVVTRPSRSRRYRGALVGANPDFCFSPSGSKERWETHGIPGRDDRDTLPIAKSVELWGVLLPEHALPQYVMGASRWLMIDSIVSMRDTVVAGEGCRGVRR